MEETVKRSEVEKLLGYGITDQQFIEALELAKHKQKHIYQRDQRPVVLQHWYLVKLTEEYVSSLALSKLTMGLCRALRDMENMQMAVN